jgi:hypothetical protein
VEILCEWRANLVGNSGRSVAGKSGGEFWRGFCVAGKSGGDSVWRANLAGDSGAGYCVAGKSGRRFWRGILCGGQIWRGILAGDSGGGFWRGFCVVGDFYFLRHTHTDGQLKLLRDTDGHKVDPV